MPRFQVRRGIHSILRQQKCQANSIVSANLMHIKRLETSRFSMCRNAML